MGLFFSDFKSFVTQLGEINYRFINIELTLGKSKYSLYNVYAPPRKGENNEFFLRLSKKIPYNPQQKEHVIIGGDLNAINSVYDKSRESKSQYKGFESMLDTERIIDPYRVANPEGRDYSFHRIRKNTPSKKYSARLDRWVTSPHMLKINWANAEIVKQVETLLSQPDTEIGESASEDNTDSEGSYRKRFLDRKSFEKAVEEAWSQNIGKFFKIINREKLSANGTVELSIDIEWEENQGWIGKTEYPEIAAQEIWRQNIASKSEVSISGKTLVAKSKPQENHKNAGVRNR